jgi:hypothetical protein
MRTLTEILGWLTGLARDEIALKLITAVIGPAIIWVWLYIFGKEGKISKPKRKHFWIVGAVCFFLLAHLFVVLTNSLAVGGKSSAPNFACEITDNVSITDMSHEPTNPPVSSIAIFHLFVLNRGTPSVAWKWKCTAQLLSGQTVVANASPNRQVIMSTNAFTKTLTTLDTTSYLPNILFEDPLGTGSGKQGWVVFNFGAGLTDELSRPGVKFTVEFEDSKGNKTLTPWIVPVNYPRLLTGNSGR